MKSSLKITLLQTTLHWENPEKNREHFGKLIREIRKGSTDLILLPEMFTTGFTMDAAALAEKPGGVTMQWMHEMAQQKNAVICGSIIIKERGHFYNRLLWMPPDGNYSQYDKRHLFRMAGEHQTYTPGKKRLIVTLKGWRICPLICYDLRFPVWSRNCSEFDLLLYVTNWPKRRRFPWSSLLVARAIENQCYVAGLNRVGSDGKNIEYSGDSVVLDPIGQPLSHFRPGKSSTETVRLEMKKLQQLRKEFPVMLDADRFRILG